MLEGEADLVCDDVSAGSVQGGNRSGGEKASKSGAKCLQIRVPFYHDRLLRNSVSLDQKNINLTLEE